MEPIHHLAMVATASGRPKRPCNHSGL